MYTKRRILANSGSFRTLSDVNRKPPVGAGGFENSIVLDDFWLFFLVK